MARCPDCIHFSLCDYNTNIAGDTKIKLYYDEGAEKCSFYKPIADVAEVVHGEWKRQKQGFYFLCSVCGRSAATKGNYCHACGAKMDKGSTQ